MKIFYVLIFLFIIMCGTAQVRLVKEDSLRNDTESIKKDIKSFESDMKNPDKGFREDRFEELKSQFLSYTEKCSTVEKEKDVVIQQLSNDNAELKSQLEKVKINSANDLKLEIEKSAKYRDDAGKYWGIVYTLVGILILLLLCAGVYIYLQIRNLGPSAVMSSLSLARKMIT